MLKVFIDSIKEGKIEEFTGANDKELVDKILIKLPFVRDTLTTTYDISKVLNVINENPNYKAIKVHKENLKVVYIPKEIVERQFLII